MALTLAAMFELLLNIPENTVCSRQRTPGSQVMPHSWISSISMKLQGVKWSPMSNIGS